MLAVGVGVHHAGLLDEMKTAMEDAFKDRVLSILYATTTLAVGVNLPARRVIVRSPRMGGGFITSSSYRCKNEPCAVRVLPAGRMGVERVWYLK